MWMSVETIATIATVVGVGVTMLVSLFGGFAWVIRRSDAHIDAVGDRLDARIAGVERELVEVKVAVARIEGPRPRFTTAR